MAKSKWVVLDELHVEVLVPRDCPRKAVRAITSKLGKRRNSVLREAMRLALGAAAVPLEHVRVRLTR